jgi:uncharacterized coiled-coil protein SlyX
MKNSLFISFLCLFAIQIKSQNTTDSTNIKNQQLINSLRNRINTIENIGNPNNVYLDEIAKLKTQVKIQNDSIEELNRLLAKSKKGKSDKVNNSIAEMSDHELSTSLNNFSATDSL